MHLSGLYYYPVKSCRGLSCDTASLDSLGLEYDRRFLIVDAAGTFLTQRGLPALACIATQITASTLQLSAPGAGSVSTPLTPPDAAPLLRRVTIWNDSIEADDCGDEPARWLTAFLGQSARLVRIGSAYRRPVRKAPAHSVGFADAFPLLAISQASLDHLNARLQTPVPMNRFRPNLVIAGAPSPHLEDTWTRLHIGADVVVRAAGPCSRCTVVTTDQFTGERGPEPLATLSTYRRRAGDPSSIDFGQNFLLETPTGILRVGDPVMPLD